MEGERERLNQRISVLTEQLAEAKFANSVETFNVRTLPHSGEKKLTQKSMCTQVIQ